MSLLEKLTDWRGRGQLGQVGFHITVSILLHVVNAWSGQWTEWPHSLSYVQVTAATVHLLMLQLDRLWFELHLQLRLGLLQYIWDLSCPWWCSHYKQMSLILFIHRCFHHHHLITSVTSAAIFRKHTLHKSWARVSLQLLRRDHGAHAQKPKTGMPLTYYAQSGVFSINWCLSTRKKVLFCIRCLRMKTYVSKIQFEQNTNYLKPNRSKKLSDEKLNWIFHCAS